MEKSGGEKENKSDRKIRITLVIADLMMGGAERAMSIMANHWTAKGWPITLLTVDGLGPPFYELDPEVRFIPLGLTVFRSNPMSMVLKHIRRIRVLRRAIEDTNPQVVISFLDRVNLITLLAVVGLGVPVIVDEQNNPAVSLKVETRHWRLWHLLRFLLYPLATKVVVLSPRALEYFPMYIQKKCAIIPNMAAVPQDENSESLLAGNDHAIISVGRLVVQKGFDMLLQAFALIAPRYSDWALEIWGEGPERANLETLRRQLKLDDRVSMPGRTKDIFAKMRQAEIFVMPSRFEGSPLALFEAMARGLPAIAFDCGMGPGEIIRDRVDGLLVPPGDVSALAAAMERLMRDPEERKRMAASAPDVLERFGTDKVMGIWEDLVFEVIR